MTVFGSVSSFGLNQAKLETSSVVQGRSGTGSVRWALTFARTRRMAALQGESQLMSSFFGDQNPHSHFHYELIEMGGPKALINELDKMGKMCPT